MSSGGNLNPSKIGGDTTIPSISPPHPLEAKAANLPLLESVCGTKENFYNGIPSLKVNRPSCLPLNKVTQCLEDGDDDYLLPLLHKGKEEELKKDGIRDIFDMSSGARKKTTFMHSPEDLEGSNIRPKTSGKESSFLNGEWPSDYQNFSQWARGTPPQEMFQDDENGGHGLACLESDISSSVGSSTPPAIKWGESLKDLLDHVDGVGLFKEFLLEEVGHCVELDFIFACKGYRNSSDNGTLKEITKIIWKNYIRNKKVKVSEATYRSIEENVDFNADPSIFDKAQAEIEECVSRTTYLSFLKSEKYISCLPKQGYESPSISPLERDESGANFLPTVHEDSEFVENKPPRLTSDMLRATAKIRASTSRRMPEDVARSYNFPPLMPPYHVLYTSGHVVSQRDSERQSLSSGMTDSQCSSTDLHSTSNRKHNKRLNQIMRDHTHQNRESDLNVDTHIRAPIPRTMRVVSTEVQELHRHPQKFVEYLTAKLEKVKQEQNCKEKTQDSLRRIMEAESAPDACLREHAVNSLPPRVLINKLTEKISIEEQEPSTILDEHVARVWDSPLVSPGSPHLTAPKSPSSKLSKTTAVSCKQLPHLAIQRPPIASSSKRFPSVPNCYGQSYSSSCVNKFAQMQLGHVDPRQHPPRSNHHGRRRERDANSTFSSDSGNVPDYHEAAEALSQMSKSKSMPDYIEGSRNSELLTEPVHRVPGLNIRRTANHRTTVDTTDSGISVVSDSGCGTGRSDSDKRIDDWLVKSCSPVSAPGKFAPFPSDEKESREIKRGPRSVTSVPNVMRHNSGSSGRSQCSTYTVQPNSRLGHSDPGMIPPKNLPLSQSYAGTPSRISPIYTSMGVYPQFDPSSRDPRDSPLGQERKNRGSSVSGRSTGQSSGQGDVSNGNGSTGSTLKKQRSKEVYPASSPIGSSHRGSSGLSCSTPSQEFTVIVYSFQEDEVPFCSKLPAGAITLKKFKHHLPKKGIYRFFFKKICEDIGTVFEEISDDSEILPLYEGRIIAQIRKDD